VDNAKNADTVVVWTQGADKNKEQQALVNALPQEKTIAVALWSVYDWQTYPNVAAYVATYTRRVRQFRRPAPCCSALPRDRSAGDYAGPTLLAGSHDTN